MRNRSAPEKLPGKAIQVATELQVRLRVLEPAPGQMPALDIRFWRRSPDDVSSDGYHPTGEGVVLPVHFVGRLQEILAELVPLEPVARLAADAGVAVWAIPAQVERAVASGTDALEKLGHLRTAIDGAMDKVLRLRAAEAGSQVVRKAFGDPSTSPLERAS